MNKRSYNVIKRFAAHIVKAGTDERKLKSIIRGLKRSYYSLPRPMRAAYKQHLIGQTGG